MRLLHISDREGITKFAPRPARTDVWPQLSGAYVWAVSDEMVHNFYLPRECPRVCWTVGHRTSAGEREAFTAAGQQRAIVAVDARWRPAIEQCVLYEYELASESFWPIDYDAGYYVSDREQRPVAVRTLTNLPEEPARARVRLEYHGDLEPIRRHIARSGYRFSNIRMANLGRPAATGPGRA